MSAQQLLVSYLPALYAEGFKPIKRWDRGQKNDPGEYIEAMPEYDQTVIDFFKAASSEYWTDRSYIPDKSWEMLQNEEFIKTASLMDIKTMLTYCVRGERFSDGHWAAMIEEGYIKRLLERLVQILVDEG